MKKTLIAITTLVLGTSLFPSHAEDAKKFKNTLNIGATLTSGNSDTLQANASLITEGEKEGLGSLRAGIEANYGESKVDGQKDTTVENAKAFGNVKKTLSPMTFASLDTSLLYDDIAEIEYRAVIAPGLGIYIMKIDSTSLFAEIGPAYVWEKVAGKSDDFLAIRIAERIEHAFSPAARIWQSLEFLPKADDIEDYLLNAELGAEAAMNARVKLRVVLKNKYDSTPGEDLKKNDLSLITGISVSI